MQANDSQRIHQALSLLRSARQPGWEASRAAAQAALSVERNCAAAWHELARAHKELGEMGAALACYRRALMLEPHNPAVLTSLGTALHGVGRREEAIRTYREALAIHPEHPGARASLDSTARPQSEHLGRLPHLQAESQRLRAAGKLGEALQRHAEALRIAPHLAHLWLSAGLLADEAGEQAMSLSFLEEAARLDPALFPAVEAARRICVSAGLFERALSYSEQAYRLRPSDDIRIARALAVPAIQPSLEALQASRRVYEQQLDEALTRNWRAHTVSAAIRMSAFFLAYHGENDSRLQAKAARLVTSVVPDLAITAAHCGAPARRGGRIRVGFVSAFMRDHSIGRTARGLVRELSRTTFEVIVLRIAPCVSDTLTEVICRSADRVIDLDPDYRVARWQIAALELDVLFFQDIGMELTSYLLAFSRLAPVQCVSFGHPNTTGIPSIDYFVSSDLLEPPDAPAHYTENLFLLSELPTLAYYYRPDCPSVSADRTQFGLHPQDHVYVCAQTAHKLHPELDAMLAGILRRDPQGIVVLMRGDYDEYTRQLQSRLARSLRELARRVLFLEPMPFRRFMQLLALADVGLDTPHFNGMCSSLDAFALGTPIVTLPGRLQRGRYTQAMYRKMGIVECIARDANDYVEIAVRLGCDRDYARTIRARILARNGVLYENRDVVREFERFFLQAARQAWGERLPH